LAKCAAIKITSPARNIIEAISTIAAEILMSLIEKIEAAFEMKTLDRRHIDAVNEAVDLLDTGKARICEKREDGWYTHQWLKKAILLYFKIQKLEVIESGTFSFYDKVPIKKWDGTEGVRVAPNALARKGSFIEPGCILMPSFVNIGAYVGAGSMVDTWVTVGSGAQIGKNVHLAGGSGIGGVLEPVQATPVIIEDNAFIGSRCVVVEGVRIGEGAVIAAGVVLTASTRILDVRKETVEVLRGAIPPNSVVVPGTTAKQFPAGEFGISCALIIGTRTESSDKKTSLTAALREFGVGV
jgi:2,3,4,5-tetrahydropyridine-2-carboxylate N-succinyltransferase